MIVILWCTFKQFHISKFASKIHQDPLEIFMAYTFRVGFKVLWTDMTSLPRHVVGLEQLHSQLIEVLHLMTNTSATFGLLSQKNMYCAAKKTLPCSDVLSVSFCYTVPFSGQPTYRLRGEGGQTFQEDLTMKHLHNIQLRHFFKQKNGMLYIRDWEFSDHLVATKQLVFDLFLLPLKTWCWSHSRPESRRSLMSWLWRRPFPTWNRTLK